MSVKLEGVELRRVAMPLVSPFRTSFGTQTARDILLLRAVTDDGEGWGECVAMSDPLYSSEYVDARPTSCAASSCPTLAASSEELLRHGAHAVDAVLHKFKGHRMAKARPRDGGARRRAAGRRAVVGPRARRGPRPRALRRVGRHHRRDPASCSTPSAATSTRATSGSSSRSSPGWDVEPVRAVRERFGDDVLLQVDANTAYTLRDARHLAKLDDFDLLLIEQPLEEEDVLGHAELARQISDAGLPRRVDRLRADRGGRHPARRVLDHQHQAGSGRRLPRGAAHPRRGRRARACRCGAAAWSRPGSAGRPTSPSPRCPGFTLPGDISASDRFYRTDITAAVRHRTTGTSTCPPGPGLGRRRPIPEILEPVTTSGRSGSRSDREPRTGGPSARMSPSR